MPSFSTKAGDSERPNDYFERVFDPSHREETTNKQEWNEFFTEILLGARDHLVREMDFEIAS